MSSKRSKRGANTLKNNTRLDKYFSVAKTADSPAQKPNVSSTKRQASVGSSRRPALMDPLEPVEVLDSGSDVELVDASSILGIPPAPKLSVSSRQGAKHHNTLKRLVQETEKRKYSFDFLEKHVMAVQLSSAQSSDNNSDQASDKSSDFGDSEDEEVKRSILGSDMARIKAQLAGNTAAITARDTVAISVFRRNLGCFQDPLCLDADSRAARMARIDCARGRRLGQKQGDELLRTMCLARDPVVAAECFSALDRVLEMRLSEWRLSADDFTQLLDRLLGHLKPSASVEPEAQDPSSPYSTAPSTPSVYVEIETSRSLTAGEKRCFSSRAAWLLDIASRALDLTSTEQSAQAAATFVCCVVDQGSGGSCMVHMQKSLVRLVDRISPSSRWAQMLPAAVKQIAQCFSLVPIGAQLFVVEALPAGNQQCTQLRQALSLAFLDMRVPGNSPGIFSASICDEHPVVAAARLVDSEKKLFVVGTDPDYGQLETFVCLLGCVLDGVQALRDRPKQTQKIRKCLAVLNRRISDGLTEGIARTLAKDAVQILLTRIDMVTSSTSAYHERNVVYGCKTNVLDRFWETSSQPVL
ncbi:hypothetical protein IWW45_006823 [Coemansia sp. RSA 485]|nr:hypothetical protein IWW45_006823 [Coemansia sp. RSA 485]